MEDLQGTLAELSRSGGTSTFLLHVKGGTDTRVKTEGPLSSDIAEGDQVRVQGTRYPDPPFIASSVVRIAPLVPKKIPWKWIAVGCAVAIVIVVAIVLLSAKTGWTVQAMDQALPAANLKIELLDAKKAPLASGITDSHGEYTFRNLKKGTYYAVDSTGATVTGVLTGSSLTSILQVHSPYMWTVRTVSCGRSATNSPVALLGADNSQVRSGQTDANGVYTFANLKKGTYTARAKSGRTATAVIDGVTAPGVAVLAVQGPMIPCFLGPTKFGQGDKIPLQQKTPFQYKPQ